MQRSALCRSRRELSNEYLLAKIGVDTAENEPLDVWGKLIQIIQYYFNRPLFLNLLLEQIANSNEYLLANIGVDTAENEPLEVWGKIQFNIHSPPWS